MCIRWGASGERGPAQPAVDCAQPAVLDALRPGEWVEIPIDAAGSPDCVREGVPCATEEITVLIDIEARDQALHVVTERSYAPGAMDLECP